MSRPKKITCAAAGLMIGLLVTSASAQFIPHVPIDYDQDMQWFAPVELDFGNEPTGTNDGYFFSYDKMYWAHSGERSAVGDPSIQREANPVWFDRLPEFPTNPYMTILGFASFIPGMIPIDPDTGQPLNPDSGPPGERTVIERAIFTNSINSTVPNAVFNWGNRYEAGYVDNERGLVLGILDGPKINQLETYGLNGGFNTGGVRDRLGLLNPLGDVYVAFDYEAGLMHGFLDVIDGVPTLPFGQVLPDDDDGDGWLDGDGYADDLDGDGQFGPDDFDTMDPAGEPDTGIVGPFTVPDYDDLVELPTSFTSVSVANNSQTHGVELMAMHVLSNRHLQAKNQNNYLELYYGARYLRFRDDFLFAGQGGVLGTSAIDTRITNNLIGPQIGLKWFNLSGRWSTKISGRFMLGYNVSNWDQAGFIGEELIPGAHNRPLYLQPHSFSYGEEKSDLAQVGELRLELSYRLSQAMAIRCGWTGIAINNIHRATSAVLWRLPDAGLIDRGGQFFFANGVTGGFEVSY